jgi:amidophosphoribosyltransferase
MDFPDENELAAAGRDVDELCLHLGADSLRFLSLEGMLEATGMRASSFCTACFSGIYPEEIVDAGIPAGLRPPSHLPGLRSASPPNMEESPS